MMSKAFYLDSTTLGNESICPNLTTDNQTKAPAGQYQATTTSRTAKSRFRLRRKSYGVPAVQDVKPSAFIYKEPNLFIDATSSIYESSLHSDNSQYLLNVLDQKDYITSNSNKKNGKLASLYSKTASIFHHHSPDLTQETTVQDELNSGTTEDTLVTPPVAKSKAFIYSKKMDQTQSSSALIVFPDSANPIKAVKVTNKSESLVDMTLIPNDEDSNGNVTADSEYVLNDIVDDYGAITTTEDIDDNLPPKVDIPSRGRTMARDSVSRDRKLDSAASSDRPGFKSITYENVFDDLAHVEPHKLPEFSPIKFDATSVYQDAFTSLAHEEREDAGRLRTIGSHFGESEYQQRKQLSTNLDTEYIKENFVMNNNTYKKHTEQLEIFESSKFPDIKEGIRKAKQNLNDTVRSTYKYIASRPKTKHMIDSHNQNSHNEQQQQGNSTNGGDYKLSNTQKLRKKLSDSGLVDFLVIKNKRGEIIRSDKIEARVILLQNQPSDEMYFPNGEIMGDLFKQVLCYRIKEGKVKSFVVGEIRYVIVELKDVN